MRRKRGRPPGRAKGYHEIICTCCGKRVVVPEKLTRICLHCFQNHGDTQEIPWQMIRNALNAFEKKMAKGREPAREIWLRRLEEERTAGQ